ncbi:MAG: hypothetical protein DM484_05250 [Candidatus Methylumidiphilus alinenensis]|uniref:Uncharacterized protein n=1 Tax=Candidatus Methylumidiphilus alinenensis TaxID=2202197 RepID=A0A2W4RGU1_9GAMM|nr:MAG: hypothetical protein DM484_05250 [Candidatus Methylumidiphilus alinenensis]
MSDTLALTAMAEFRTVGLLLDLTKLALVQRCLFGLKTTVWDKDSRPRRWPGAALAKRIETRLRRDARSRSLLRLAD